MLLRAFIEILSAFPLFYLHVSNISSFPPPLDPDTERELFLKKANGDSEAREKLILHNLRLVAHIVKKHYTSAKNQDDLLSIGTIGLIKAIDTFDLTNGARFATYAAALSVTKEGAVPSVPTLRQVKEFAAQMREEGR